MTAYEFIKANPVFHIATVDKDKPRVRPFGFIMKRNNTLYFCTNKNKEVYRQLSENPNIEISVVAKDGSSWLRVKGTIAFDESRDAKVQAFKESPNLLRVYPRGADDDVFVTFYFVSAQAMLFSFASGPQEIPLM